MCYYKSQFFLNLLDSNTTNTVKYISIIPTKEIQKKNLLVVKKMMTLQKPVPFLKKVVEY